MAPKLSGIERNGIEVPVGSVYPGPEFAGINGNLGATLLDDAKRRMATAEHGAVRSRYRPT